MKKLIAVLLFGLTSTGLLANPLPSEPHIYVEGSARIEVEPDEMSFSIQIASTKPTLAEAKGIVDERSRTLIALCKKLGISSKDIATTTLRIRPSYSFENNKRVPNGTIVSRDVDIHLRDLAKYSDVMKAFVDAEISKTISTKLLVSDKSSLTDQALVEALADAHKRAKLLAAAQGKRLGDAYSISEFMSRREESYSLRVSRGISGQSSSNMSETRTLGFSGNEPFEPGVMVAEAQVFVVYLLN